MSSKNLATILYNYFNSFCNAYNETFVPKDAVYPFLTFSYSYTELETNLIQVKIYDKSKSFVKITEITDKISEDVGFGKLIKVGSDTVWVRRGNPFSQMIADEDETIRSMYINLEINYL